VDVAKATMFNPLTVVVPVDEISSAEMVDVAMFTEDDVAMKKLLPILLNFHMSSVLFPCRAICACEVEAIKSRAALAENDVSEVEVVVPIPRLPVKNDGVVVVEIKFPTVSCVLVAIKLPEPLDTMMELMGYVPVFDMKPESLVNHDSWTDDEAMVFTFPAEPV
jgi:hypothetical protein